MLGTRSARSSVPRGRDALLRVRWCTSGYEENIIFLSAIKVIKTLALSVTRSPEHRDSCRQLPDERPLQIGLQLPMLGDWQDIGRFQDRFKFEIQNSRDALTPSKRVCIPHSIADVIVGDTESKRILRILPRCDWIRTNPDLAGRCEDLRRNITCW
jgi:hypothetical protein